MVRRRNSAPSPLQLTPATVPLRRGQPKFTLPSPPSSQAMHLASHQPLKKTADPSKVTPVKEMPRLDIPVGVHGFSSQSSDEWRGEKEPERASGDCSTPESGSGAGKERSNGWAMWLRPWTGRDAMLPQVASW